MPIPSSAAYLLNFSRADGNGFAQTAGQQMPQRQSLPPRERDPNSVKSRGKGGKNASHAWHEACDSFGGTLSLESQA